MDVATQSRKTVLITGCSPGGIGYALCQEFRDKGLYVIATARRPEVVEDLIGKGFTTLELDVTKPESIASCKQKVVELTGGRLDILVNNAGRTLTVPATDLDLDEVRYTFEINVYGPMAMVQAFVPLLIPTRGSIVMVSSLAALSPYVFGSAYSATKGALTSYSRTLRQELRPFGIRVIISMTGAVRSHNADLVRELSPDSLYTRVADAYQRRLRFSQGKGSWDARVFARALVNKVLREPGWFGRLFGGSTDWVWAGKLAWPIRLARILLGELLIDHVAYRLFGMKRLEDIVKKDEAKKIA